MGFSITLELKSRKEIEGREIHFHVKILLQLLPANAIEGHSTLDYSYSKVPT